MYLSQLALLLRTALPLLAATTFIVACGDKDRSSSSSKDDEDGTGGASGSGGRLGMGGDPDDFEPVACDTDPDCDDYFYCNGEERCVDGLCRRGSPIDCDDGIDCTVDRCVEDRQECLSEAPDDDGDGHADATCEDETGEPLGDDCDDNDSLAYPGNQEVCDQDNRDEDCNPETFGTLDADQDGFVDANCANEDDDGNVFRGDDCDDRKPGVNPLAQELCDFLDNNCDGETDEGVSISMYEDKDHDGRGDDDAGTVQTCLGAVGYSQIAGDCDDEDPEVFTGQFEICDDKDNNCNGQADEVRELAPWYKDVDGDGYGDAESTPVFSCYRVPGRVLSQNDCNDSADGGNTVNPNAPEICDGLDNDCNGTADFKLAGVNNFEDDDGDGAADADCGGPDCNDLDPRTSEGAEEVCDRIDNDCDGEVDEQTVQNIWYIDEDGDGWGVVIGSALASCDPVAGRASQFGDCNDNERDIKPGMTELCDGIDNDCDGIVDEGAGSHCELENALNTCRFGRCAIFSCLPGYQDADSNPENGCEAVATPTTTTTECSYDSFCNDANLCNGIETCFNGFCRLGSPINCSAGPGVLQGDFTITGGRDILDLSGIETITGDLFINSPGLTSLVGLESLKIVGGNLYIQGNNGLTRLSGSALSGLEMVGGDILIQNNQNLRSVALPSLTSARSLIIDNNDSLETIDGLGALTNVDVYLQISNNDALLEIEDTPALARIGGDYDALPGDSIQPLPCSGLGGVQIDNNPLLTTVTAFANLAQVEGDICFFYNPNLQGLSFDSLDNVGHAIEFEDLDSLTTFTAPNLRSIGGGLRMGGGESDGVPVSSLSLPSLIGIGGEVRYAGLGSDLTEISFPNLLDAGGIVIDLFGDADLLTTVDFTALEMASDISIYYSASSAGLTVWEFPELTDVQSAFSVYLSADITSLRAPLLQNIGGSFTANVYSEAMASIDFGALEQVGGYFDLSYGSEVHVMNSIDFGSLSAVEFDFYLSGNVTTVDIGQLMTIGGASNMGYFYAYVGPYDICTDVTRLQTPPSTFTGTFDTNCPQQTQSEL